MSYELKNELAASVERHQQSHDFNGEIAVLRGLIERTLQDTDDPSAALAKTEKSLAAIAKLAQVARKLEIERGDLIHRDEAMQIAAAIARKLSEIMQEHVAEEIYFAVIDDFSRQLPELLAVKRLLK